MIIQVWFLGPQSDFVQLMVQMIELYQSILTSLDISTSLDHDKGTESTRVSNVSGEELEIWLMMML